MMLPFARSIRQISGRLPLRIVLTVPFILQIVASTGLVGYLAYRNGQRAVGDLTDQLIEQTSDRVDQHLDSYLAIPNQINQVNLDAIETGILDINNFQQAGQFFRKQLDTYRVSYISYGLTDGSFIGAGYAEEGGDLIIDEVSSRTRWMNDTYAADSQGNRLRVVDQYPYDFLNEDWFRATVAENKVTWSEVYASQEQPNLLWIANNAPIRNRDGKVLGVLSVDFLLSDISAFIEKIHLSQHSRIFIIERTGALIANSTLEASTIGGGDQIRQRTVFESQDSLVRATAKYLQRQFTDFKNIQGSQRLTFDQDGQRQFVQVDSWKDSDGLDWLVVMVVPESDFMAQIHQNTRNTILLCIVTLLVATHFGIWTARWVTNPLLKLKKAAGEIENGNLDQSITLDRRDELGSLAQSFNHMAGQLNQSFNQLKTVNAALTESEQQLQRYSQTLEEQVQERTHELSDTLEQLKTTQAGLIESEKLAALGQLVAGIAHEINTPLGAIQASIGNIDYSLKRSLSQIPELFQILPAHQLENFFVLLELATQPRQLLSSREERQLRRQLTQSLTEQGVEHAAKLADTLSKMGISEGLDSFAVLLKHPEVLSVLESAYSLSSIRANSQNIQLAVERASKIVFALKAYVRQEQTGQKTKAVITDGIETVLTVYYSQIKQGVEVTRNYGSILPILCYPDELVQVWSNLIMNAVQAMHYKGKLDIHVTQDEQQVTVQIADSGPGIPPELMDKIFAPFFTTKPMGEGSGLGLHLVRQIIEKHQGQIEVSNTSMGAMFTVRLPILDPVSDEL